VSGVRSIIAAGCLVFLGVIGAYLVVNTIRQGHDASRQRRSYASLTPDDRAEYVSRAFDVPAAFRRFRATLHRGDRFAVLFAPQESAARLSFYNSFIPYYFYPAIEVGAVSSATYVLVLDPHSASVEGFRPVARIGDATWIGERR
jgi:hypothetical protein